MYADLDGRSSGGGGPIITQVFTQANDVTVRCTNEPRINFQAKASFANICDSRIGGIKCQAFATLSGYRIPRSFLEQGTGGTFKVAHYKQAPWVVCADGRVVNGDEKCPGYVSMLLDDWAFSSPSEAGECKVLDGEGCVNKPYYRVVKKLFETYGAAQGTAASDMARGLTGDSPYDENTFWMSFEGEDSAFGPFREQENGGDQDPNDWVTSPGAGSPVAQYASSYSSRETCWLGLPCQ
jgi:hypothetical protein